MNASVFALCTGGSPIYTALIDASLRPLYWSPVQKLARFKP